jgi:hypothetical protein
LSGRRTITSAQPGLFEPSAAFKLTAGAHAVSIVAVIAAIASAAAKRLEVKETRKKFIKNRLPLDGDRKPNRWLNWRK